MNELELLLSEAGAALEWPQTPDLAGAVRARVRAEGVPRGEGVTPRHTGDTRRFRLRRPLALALAALLVLAAGAAAIPGVRDPVLDFLGLRSVKIERVPKLPLRPAPGASLGLGERSTLEAARPRLGFTPLVPAALGPPTVWLDDTQPGGQLGLVYRNGHLLLTEVEGRLHRQFLQKFVGPGASVDRVVIARQHGLWIHGAVHEVVYEDRNGEIRPDTVRLVGSTLLWRHGNVLMRLEGARGKAEALRIARSVRGTP